MLAKLQEFFSYFYRTPIFSCNGLLPRVLPRDAMYSVYYAVASMSVRLSVLQIRSRIVSKRLNVLLKYFHRLIATSLNDFQKFRRGSLLTGTVNTGGA